MPDTPPARPPAAIGPNGLPSGPATPSPWPPTPPTTLAKRSPWPTFVALALAIIAVGIAVAGWFRPIDARTSASPTPLAPAFTEQQIAEAKAKICTAFETVHAGARLQTHPVRDDSLAATANARLSLAVGSAYLLARLDPATPPPLAAATRTLADNLLELTAHALAGEMNDDPAQATRLRNADDADVHVAEQCK